MDTVGVAGMESPFTPVGAGRPPARPRGRRHEGVARGDRCWSAPRRSREGFRGDVIVTAVADEEVGSVGTEALVRRTTADAAIVTEPTEEEMINSLARNRTALALQPAVGRVARVLLPALDHGSVK